MTEIELAWLAGLLEGEGSCLFPPPSEPNAPRVAISMTDEDVIQRVAILLGVSSVHIRLHQKNPNWKPADRAQVKGTRAVTLIRRLRPFMGQRRGERIDEILATVDQAPPGPRQLSEAEAQAILCRKGQSRARDVAAEYDLHIKSVEGIWNGKRWSHLQATTAPAIS